MSTPGSAVVMVAPNGARRTKADHRALPIGTAELARCAAECREAGASAIHIHVRDAQAQHVLDAELYAEAIGAIRAEAGPEMVIQITTEAVGRYAPEAQRAVVHAVRPEAVSVALREMIPDAAALSEAVPFYIWCAREGVAVQHILYSAEDFERLLDLRAKGDLPGGGLSVLFVLGRYTAGQQSEPGALVPFLQILQTEAAKGIVPMVCAFGSGEAACLASGLAFGAHARVGFENSIVRPDGTPLDDNAESVARTVSVAQTLGYRGATREETLLALGL